MSEYILREAKVREELDAIIDVIWKVQNSRRFRAFFPLSGSSAQDKAVAIAESKNRLWASHCRTQASHWVYVIESSTGQVVAATQWQIQDASAAHFSPMGLEATWYPEGEEREFATEVIRQTYLARHQFLKGPYIGK